MEMSKFDNNYDPDIMDTKKAKYLINYMKNHHETVVNLLNANDSFFSFLYPFVIKFMDCVSEEIIIGISSSDAVMEQLKVICSSLDQECIDIESNN